MVYFISLPYLAKSVCARTSEGVVGYVVARVYLF